MAERVLYEKEQGTEGDECGREYGIGWLARWVVHDETASWLGRLAIVRPRRTPTAHKPSPRSLYVWKYDGTQPERKNFGQKNHCVIRIRSRRSESVNTGSSDAGVGGDTLEHIHTHSLSPHFQVYTPIASITYTTINLERSNHR